MYLAGCCIGILVSSLLLTPEHGRRFHPARRLARSYNRVRRIRLTDDPVGTAIPRAMPAKKSLNVRQLVCSFDLVACCTHRSSAWLSYWGGLIEELEQRRPDGCLSIAIALRGVVKDDQGKVEHIFRRASREAGKKGPLVMTMSYGPISRHDGVIVLVRGGRHELTKLKIDLREA